MSVRPSGPLPWALITAVFLLVTAAALLVCGVYVLAGAGWALLSGVPVCCAFSFLIIRGL